jgi:hypothetical protein
MPTVYGGARQGNRIVGSRPGFHGRSTRFMKPDEMAGPCLDRASCGFSWRGRAALPVRMGRSPSVRGLSAKRRIFDLTGLRAGGCVGSVASLWRAHGPSGRRTSQGPCRRLGRHVVNGNAGLAENGFLISVSTVFPWESVGNAGQAGLVFRPHEIWSVQGGSRQGPRKSVQLSDGRPRKTPGPRREACGQRAWLGQDHVADLRGELTNYVKRRPPT